MYIEVNAEDIDPLDVCPVTVHCLINIGSLGELVRRQPENKEAADRLERALELFKGHLAECDKCRKALDDPQEEEA